MTAISHENSYARSLVVDLEQIVRPPRNSSRFHRDRSPHDGDWLSYPKSFATKKEALAAPLIVRPARSQAAGACCPAPCSASTAFIDSRRRPLSSASSTLTLTAWPSFR